MSNMLHNTQKQPWSEKNMLTCDMKFNIYRKWKQKNRAHYIWKLCTHHFDRCQNCHLSFMHQMVFSVKFTSQMAYGDRWELFTYLKLCIILCRNIIFISRFKCVVHHFKLFAVEWRYSFAVEWRFTKPKSKKKNTRFSNVSIEYGTTCTYGFWWKLFILVVWIKLVCQI